MFNTLKLIFKNRKGFIWYLFEKEAQFFLVGFVLGLAFIILWAMGIIPLPFSVCDMVG